MIKQNNLGSHQYPRALFNCGIKRNLISENPTNGIEFLPEEKKKKYVPPKADALKVINSADPDTQDYLWSIVCTAARMNEINSLTWNDVNFENRCVTLWTRKKKGGNRKTTEGYLQSIEDAERNAMQKIENVDIFSAPLPGKEDRPTNTHPGYWKRKVPRPDYEVLCDEIKKLGYVGASKKYGVSDNAVRKWKKHYESQFEN